MMVFAGAFVGLPESPETHDFLKFGMIPEFMGRISAVANLNALTVEDIARIISEPKQSVLEHHQQLFRAQNSELQLTTVGARAIAEKAIALGTGARGLNRIISDMLTDAYFNLPEKPGKYRRKRHNRNKRKK
jgi:ATP-dependent Clp protease ATP-binding subunit ClpX